MNLNPPESLESDRIFLGVDWKRRKTSGVYYVFAKRNGKQFSHPLKTTDRKSTIRLRDDFLHDLDRLANAAAAQITFEELAERWIEAERPTLK